ncbi:MAG: RnfABCDGE type electron transport complex subunit G [Candidatus Marinimicrobia bacterium]|nr:RnfABCDGE type electron transport complex subunit G [Candidatus Neomarinimicrobiota bacterium]
MSNTAKIIIVLTLITVISGAVLAVLDNYTKPRIEAYKNKVKNEAVYEVLPQNVKVKTIVRSVMENDKTVEYTFYEASIKNEVVAYAFQVAGGGFQSELVLMVSVKPDFSEIINAKILAQVETPGLGTRIENDPSNKENPAWFIDQFKGLKANPEITYIKNVKPSKDTEIQAITGATISSAAIVRILNAEIKKAKAVLLSNGVAENNEPNKEDILAVLPENAEIQKIEKNGQVLYSASKGKDILAYAIPAACKGYQSEISLMIGVKADFSEILGVKVISQSETPGWGTKIVNDPANENNPCWFIDQFKGVKINSDISFVLNKKPENKSGVQAITGATISSAAVVDIINTSIKEAKALLNK